MGVISALFLEFLFCYLIMFPDFQDTSVSGLPWGVNTQRDACKYALVRIHNVPDPVPGPPLEPKAPLGTKEELCVGFRLNGTLTNHGEKLFRDCETQDKRADWWCKELWFPDPKTRVREPVAEGDCEDSLVNKKNKDVFTGKCVNCVDKDKTSLPGAAKPKYKPHCGPPLPKPPKPRTKKLINSY